jgi:hypothetical protein
MRAEQSPLEFVLRLDTFDYCDTEVCRLATTSCQSGDIANRQIYIVSEFIKASLNLGKPMLLKWAPDRNVSNHV